ncbi:hypothetical protein [Sphingobium cloacae]|uniref:Uncharacterized protein n=1 Tax=Sphingobium cloacae TaxID=120107 RepID=A0A1E1F6R1_9SPHN|nr:hypothetical protein [Sphingobium cloacae]BAV66212.1 hypothetical protein SCLO_1031720 [Sphingobium cloacae]
MGQKQSRNAIVMMALGAAITASVPSPSLASPGQAYDAAIFRAAGFTQKGGIWTSGCDKSGDPPSPAVVEERRDLNGDGRPEAIVSESSLFCYGNTGQAFWLLSQQADGQWKLMAQDVGIPDILKTKGVAGWPDIAVGGPGFCFPVLRWDGGRYRFHRREYEGKPCR